MARLQVFVSMCGAQVALAVSNLLNGFITIIDVIIYDGVIP